MALSACHSMSPPLDATFVVLKRMAGGSFRGPFHFRRGELRMSRCVKISFSVFGQCKCPLQLHVQVERVYSSTPASLRMETMIEII